MKIVAAVDSFKGSLSSVQAAACIETGIRRVIPGAEIVKIPVADGGEGTVDAFLEACGGRKRKVPVHGPLGQRTEAAYAILPDGTAVIETAQAAGLTLVSPEERRPLDADTYGVGELIRDALEMGSKSLIIGLGGSASTDGGLGMARALGIEFLSQNGELLSGGGRVLHRVAAIRTDGRTGLLKACRVAAATDVASPLCGKLGAAYVYGSQKGADPEQIERLDQGLANYAAVVEQTLGEKLAGRPGAGAAGGLGMALMAFCHGELRPGIDLILDAARFEEHLEGTDMVITGEGRLDSQTVLGKVPSGVAARTKKYGDIPVLAVAGSLGEGAELAYKAGIDGIFSIADGPMTLEEAINKGEELLTKAVERLFRLLCVCSSPGRFG